MIIVFARGMSMPFSMTWCDQRVILVGNEIGMIASSLFHSSAHVRQRCFMGRAFD
jgi:hypothetical protein